MNQHCLDLAESKAEEWVNKRIMEIEYNLAELAKHYQHNQAPKYVGNSEAMLDELQDEVSDFARLISNIRDIVEDWEECQSSPSDGAWFMDEVKRLMNEFDNSDIQEGEESNE
jgi:DNA-binding transcriptional regulator YiaG